MVDSAFAVATAMLLFRPIEDSAILGKSLAGADDVWEEEAKDDDNKAVKS